MNLIVADIGGTNARLAFQKNINSEICLIENFLCSEFKSLEDIITAYKEKHNIINEHISIGVAGPCEDDDVLLSNNHIKFNKKQLLKNLNLKSLLVINDFLAQSFVFKNLLLEEDEEKYKILFKTCLTQIFFTDMIEVRMCQTLLVFVARNNITEYL